MTKMTKSWLCLVILLTTGTVRAAENEIRLTPQEAVSRALRQNLDLAKERLSPALSDAPEEAAQAAFDPVLFGDTTLTRTDTGFTPKATTTAGVDVGVRKTFSTTGTSVEAKLGTSGVFGESGHGGLSPAYATAVSLAVHQPLLKGASRDANEIGITDARLGREAASERLDRKAETVAQDTLKAYWDLHGALSQINVAQIALDLSEKTLADTQSLIKSGKLAAAEEATAKYQVEAQRRTLLTAQQAAENARDKLARLIGLVGPHSLETPRIVTVANPQTELPRQTLASLQSAAFERRGDRRAALTDETQSRANAQAADHELLPKLDLVGGLTLAGVSGDVAPGATGLGSFDNSYWSSFATQNVGFSVGLSLEIPLGNSAAKARKEMADIDERHAELALDEVDQQISEELNLAWRGVNAAREQLRVTESAADLAATKATNELERFRAGKTTAQILTTVQADLAKERLAKEQAIADYNKALVDLNSASGTLIDGLNLNNNA
jgi:outer membrane protein TolC